MHDSLYIGDSYEYRDRPSIDTHGMRIIERINGPVNALNTTAVRVGWSFTCSDSSVYAYSNATNELLIVDSREAAFRWIIDCDQQSRDV